MGLRHFAIFSLVLCGLMAGACSRKGVTMPTHRKRKHCDCPTFSLRTPPPAEDEAYAFHPL